MCKLRKLMMICKNLTIYEPLNIIITKEIFSHKKQVITIGVVFNLYQNHNVLEINSFVIYADENEKKTVVLELQCQLTDDNWCPPHKLTFQFFVQYNLKHCSVYFKILLIHLSLSSKFNTKTMPGKVAKVQSDWLALQSFHHTKPK